MRVEPPIPRDALAAIRAPFEGAGAELVEPSVLQPLNLMLDLAGEPMRARLFVVQDEGGREACLRPDFTVAVVRDFVASRAPAGRFWYEGKAFRVSPPGMANHAEEFVQIGFEAFGTEDVAAAEAPSLAWRAALAGGRDDLSMHISDVGLFRAFLADIGVSPKLVARLRRLLPQPRALAEELDRAQRPDAFTGAASTAAEIEAFWRANDLVAVGGRTAEEIAARLARRAEEAAAPRLSSGQADLIGAYLRVAGGLDEAVARIRALAEGPELSRKMAWWRELPEGLARAGIPADRVSFSAQVASPFVYYDDFMFDITSAALGADRPVCSGGRYDSLVGLLGGDPKATAVGCVVRPWRAYERGAQ